MELLKSHWNEEKLFTELDRIAAMIQPYLLPEQREFREEEWEIKENYQDQFQADPMQK